MKVRIIGAGLAGCEAANYLANKKIEVELYEMRPIKYSPAHKTASRPRRRCAPWCFWCSFYPCFIPSFHSNAAHAFLHHSRHAAALSSARDGVYTRFPAKSGRHYSAKKSGSSTLIRDSHALYRSFLQELKFRVCFAPIVKN